MARKPANTTTARVLALARRQGVIRLRDLAARGIHPEHIRRLCDRGLMTKVGRGLYALADREPSEHLDLIEAAQRVPHGVVCLLSALHFHGIGTQMPREVWMLIDRRAHKPRVDDPPMRFLRASGAALTEGVQRHTLDGVKVAITVPAKTVADCFKYRNKIGLDVALEAVRDYWRGRHGTVDTLVKFARIDRVERVMRPYLEATI